MPWVYIGQVSPRSAFTSDQDGALAVSTRQDAVAIGETIHGVLARFGNPVFAVFDPNSGRFYSSDSTTDRDAFLAALADHSHRIVLKPDTAQTGRSLAWSVETDETWPSRADQVDTLIDPVKPKRSVGALVNKLLTPLVGEPVLLALNQATAKVEVRRYAGTKTVADVAEDLESITPAGNCIGLQLTIPPGRESEPEWPVP